MTKKRWKELVSSTWGQRAGGKQAVLMSTEPLLGAGFCTVLHELSVSSSQFAL